MLRKSGIRIVIEYIIAVPFMALVFFLALGHTNLMSAWVFFCVAFIGSLSSILVLANKHPEVLNHRGERKKGTKIWDKFFPAFLIFGYYAQIIVAGLDLGRYHWSFLNLGYIALGIVLYMIGAYVLHLAMAENTHFEKTVRIQEDRNHHVISTGPYRYIRHPGYFGAILWSIGIPLALGSIYSLLLGVFVIIMIIIRTALEDATLKRELAGYLEYTQKIRYRLFPGIW